MSSFGQNSSQLESQEILVFNNYDASIASQSIFEYQYQTPSKLQRSIQSIKSIRKLEVGVAHRELQPTPKPEIQRKKQQSTHDLSQFPPNTIVKRIIDIDQFYQMNQEDTYKLCLIPTNLLFKILSRRKEMQEQALQQRRLITKLERKSAALIK